MEFRIFVLFLFTLLFRPSFALQGDSWCGTFMCVRAFLNGTQWTYQMRAYVGESGFGWMAIGFGTVMTDAAMVIMWPNPDGSVTLSQRAAAGHIMPTVVPNPPRVATTYLQLSSQTADQTNLAFTIAPNGQTSQSLVWAIATARPSSSAVDATIMQHIASGAINLDLSLTFTDNTVGSANPTGDYLPPFPTSTSGSNSPVFQLPPLLPYQNMLMAHAILCGVGFLVILPTGALIARWGRVFTNSWFRAHWIFQAVFGIPIITAGWFLAVAGVVAQEGSHFDDTHKVIGLALFGAYILQVLLGVNIHFLKPATSRRARPIPGGTGKASVVQMISTSTRPPLNYVHAVLGLSIITLAFYQVYLGMTYEWNIATGRGDAPPVVLKFWIAWVVLLPTFYIVGLALLPRQLRKERRDGQKKARGSDAVPLKRSPPSSKRDLLGVKTSAPTPAHENGVWKREGRDGEMEQDQTTNAHDAVTEDTHAPHSMTEDTHAPHSMQQVQFARAL